MIAHPHPSQPQNDLIVREMRSGHFGGSTPPQDWSKSIAPAQGSLSCTLQYAS